MGLNKDSGRKNFLTIGNGKIVLQHQNPIDGVTTERVNKNGKTVHEETFTSITAMITNISSKDTPFGRVWEIELTDDQVYLLSFNYSSRYTNNFFRALPNIDLTQPVKIAPWSMTDKKDSSKTVIGMSISQNGEKVPFKWDKDNPGELPQMVKIKRKGKEEWDDSDQLAYFEAMLVDDILPQLKKGVTAAVEAGGDSDEAPF